MQLRNLVTALQTLKLQADDMNILKLTAQFAKLMYDLALAVLFARRLDLNDKACIALTKDTLQKALARMEHTQKEIAPLSKWGVEEPTVVQHRLLSTRKSAWWM